jgi:ribosomal protein S6--L-glutamate ligase
VTPSLPGAVRREELVGVVGWPQPTSERLVEAWRELGIHAGMLSPADASSLLRPHDVAVGRFDVRATLDGVQPGLHVLVELERQGVRVINRVEALMNAHDKLRTARLLTEADLPHPKTAHITSLEQVTEIAPPVVVKPRFGSWGIDVFRCETGDDLTRTLAAVSARPWFVRHGALVQELVPPTGYDLRLIVAAGQVVGATERVARPGEWRTNVSLGGTRRPTRPSREACALAVGAATLIGADLVGVDLLPSTSGYVVLELNGAVEFDRAYDLEDSNVFAAAASALGLPRLTLPRRSKLSSGSPASRSRGRSRPQSRVGCKEGSRQGRA